MTSKNGPTPLMVPTAPPKLALSTKQLGQQAKKPLQLRLNVKPQLPSGGLSVPMGGAQTGVLGAGSDMSHLLQGVVQDFWLYVKLQNAYIPNRFVDYSQRDRKAVVRVTLLERTASGALQPLTKSAKSTKSVLPYEQQTTLNGPDGQSDAVPFVLPITSQPQTVYANNAFQTVFRQTGSTEPTKQLLDVEDFPLGNSAVVKFGGERLIFNEQAQNVQENAIVLIELIQLPTWGNATDLCIGWGCFKLSELSRQQDSRRYLRVKLYKGEEQPLILKEMYQMFQLRPSQPDVGSFSVETAKSFQLIPKKTELKKIGLLQLKFGYLSQEQIVQERIVKKNAIYPYDRELNGAEIDARRQETHTEAQQVVDFSKYDARVKERLDRLHQASLEHQNAPAVQIVNSSRANASAFLSGMVSAVAGCPVGNVCLGAAAVQCASEQFNVVLYDLVSGGVLVTLGTHYGYVYGLQFTGDGRFLLSCSADGTVNVYQVQMFSYYGFNFFFAKSQEAINKEHEIISKKRRGEKLDDREEDGFKAFERFVRDTAARQPLLYQWGDLLADLEALDVCTKVSNDTAGDLDSQLTALSQEALGELAGRFLAYQISEGVCVYDVAQVNARPPEPLTAKQIGVLHDTKVKRPFQYVDLQLVCGTLSGQVVYHRIVQQEAQKKPATARSLLEQHPEYVNCIRVSQLTDRTLVASGDAGGQVRFIELREHQNQVASRLQSTIQTLKNLKDFALLKGKNKELRLLAINAFGVAQIFDSQGTFQASVNDQLDVFNQQSLVESSRQTQVKMHSQRLQIPGRSRLTTDAQRRVCFVPGYGGSVVAVSPSGRVLQAFWALGQPQCGVFITGLQLCAAGLLVSFGSLATENRIVLGSFQPAGAPRYSQLPALLIGAVVGGMGRQFQGGQVVEAEQERQEFILKSPDHETEAALEQGEFQVVAEQGAGDLQAQVTNFLDFIREQRGRMAK